MYTMTIYAFVIEPVQLFLLLHHWLKCLFLQIPCCCCVAAIILDFLCWRYITLADSALCPSCEPCWSMGQGPSAQCWDIVLPQWAKWLIWNLSLTWFWESGLILVVQGGVVANKETTVDRIWSVPYTLYRIPGYGQNLVIRSFKIRLEWAVGLEPSIVRDDVMYFAC